MDPSKCQDAHNKKFSKFEDILQLEIYLFGFDFIDGELIVELVC